MSLKLKRPLAVFDLETTGTNLAEDRIVECSVLVIQPDGSRSSFTGRFNPEMPIPPESTEIHGITDKEVADAPTFKEKAQELYSIFEPCDLAGFNSNRFDVPILVEEFLRAEIFFDLDNRKLVDVQRIFHLMEQRTLSAAYKFYCNKDLTNAHSAEADVNATIAVLEAQVDRYENLENDIEFLAKFSTDGDFVDTARRIKRVKGEPVFNFGKYKNQKVSDVLSKDPGYYGWIMNNAFPLHTKQKLKEIKLAMSFK
jgi:DNA polymerase-3 subunit epsilon